MRDDWDDFFDGVDWDAVLRETPDEQEKTKAAFRDAAFDYKRSYIRKILKTRPELTDVRMIDYASEQMLESHTEGVELDVDDALRLAAHYKPKTTEEIVQMLFNAGARDGNFFDTVFMFDPNEAEEPAGTVRNADAAQKAGIMTVLAERLAGNPNVLLLGLPVFDPLSSWTQVKLAVFSEKLSDMEKECLQVLKSVSDKYFMREQSGATVLTFQIFPLWDD
ncbi:MAG: hypothetical protein IJT62_02540 [Oscillospiraceae bacterium]|nr:hypothetical protein [Oscillospiraceae bacterium]